MELFKIIAFWLKNQKPITKLFIVMFFLFLVVSIVVSARYSLLKYHYFKEKEKQVETLRDSLDNVNKHLLYLSAKGQEVNKKAKTKVIKVSEKLKQDEKIIHDTPVSNDELVDFLSNYERKSRQH